MTDFGFDQLPLSFGLRDDKTLDTYYPGNNAQIMTQIKLMAQKEDELFVYLWGREGVGKTHLLQGACHWASDHQVSAMYLSLVEILSRHTPALLEGLERIELVCLDDIEAVAGNAQWEEALFHFFNRSRAAGQRLIIAGNAPLKSLPIKLADLHSRLTWGITYHAQGLADEQLLEALQLRAKQRGLELSHEVGAFLVRRCARSMPKLYELLERLDKASLAAQRRLTIPFVKSILKI